MVDTLNFSSKAERSYALPFQSIFESELQQHSASPTMEEPKHAPTGAPNDRTKKNASEIPAASRHSCLRRATETENILVSWSVIGQWIDLDKQRLRGWKCSTRKITSLKKLAIPCRNSNCSPRLLQFPQVKNGCFGGATSEQVLTHEYRCHSKLMVTCRHSAGPGKHHGAEKARENYGIYSYMHLPWRAKTILLVQQSQKVGQRSKEIGTVRRGLSSPCTTHVTAYNIALVVAVTSAGKPKAKKENQPWLV